MKQMGILYITESFLDHQKTLYSGVEHEGTLTTHAVLWYRT